MSYRKHGHSFLQRQPRAYNNGSLLELLLGAKLRGMSALPLPAVGGLGGETRIALTTDGLITVEFPRQHGKRGVVDAATKPQDKVKSGLLLDVVVGQGSAIL